jgi:lysylphosphatidylglycerol synthetase-like protein (DUF2156 family)
MKKSIWQIIAISGAVSALIYMAHVVLGGILWPEYNHVTQTISELTADGAPNASFLRILTTIYGILAIVFSVSLYFFSREKGFSKAAKTGAILLIIMEVVSLVGYGLFPLSEGGTEMDPQNIGHLIVTGIVVLCTVTCGFFIGLGLRKTALKRTGIFVFVCAIIMVLAGGFTPAAMANNLPVAGLVERINIFTLQLWIFVLSLRIFVDGRAMAE